MSAIEKLTMQSPEGTLHMVTSRDRAAFEARGYLYVGPFADEPGDATDAAGTVVTSPVPAAIQRESPVEKPITRKVTRGRK